MSMEHMDRHLTRRRVLWNGVASTHADKHQPAARFVDQHLGVKTAVAKFNELVDVVLLHALAPFVVYMHYFVIESMLGNNNVL